MPASAKKRSRPERMFGVDQTGPLNAGRRFEIELRETEAVLVANSHCRRPTAERAAGRESKCEGTVEDHRNIALDVRELIRKRVLEQPVGTAFRPNLAFPWLRVMRLNSTTLDLELVSGRTVIVPLVWASCGIMGRRTRLQCPLCGRRICTLYYLEPRLACRVCNGLRYAAQRASSYGRKALAKRKIRRKLGDHGQLWAVELPPKPRGMWRRTYARHCAALIRIARA